MTSEDILSDNRGSGYTGTMCCKNNIDSSFFESQAFLTLRAPIETIVSLQDQPAGLPSHYQNIPYQPKTTVHIWYPESTPDTNYQSLFR